VVRSDVVVAGAELVVNPDPGRGMRSSLELAVSAADATQPLVVILVDVPGIGADTVRAVLDAWRPGRVAVARYATRLGHPVAMEPALWRGAIALAGPDEGARTFFAARPDLLVQVPVPGDPGDIDTPADLTALGASPDVES
ncbi:MAG TPA: NTP transferase domain-containing protein, partial [Jatrophihabitantaceae bacterium]|nr:NTP transferase domain-containing protein [Jatrophihabitantaceae bacterium]